MLNPEALPGASPATHRVSKWRRPLLLASGVLAVATAAVLVLAAVDRVRDAADRAH